MIFRGARLVWVSTLTVTRHRVAAVPSRPAPRPRPAPALKTDNDSNLLDSHHRTTCGAGRISDTLTVDSSVQLSN